MDATEIIEALGGYAALAASLRLSKPAVHRWQATGIPPTRWAQLARMAVERGLAGPFRDARGNDQPGITIESLMQSEPRPSPNRGRPPQSQASGEAV